LYAKRDPDLVALYLTLGRKGFVGVCKDALFKLVRVGYVPKFILPPNLRLNCPKEAEDIKFELCLGAKKDEDIRLLLSKVGDRKFGAFLKIVIRYYLGPVLCLQAFLDTDAEFAEYEQPKQMFFIGGASAYTAPVRKIKERKPAKKKEKPVSFPEKKTGGYSVSEIPVLSSVLHEGAEPQADTGEVTEDEMLDLLNGLLG
jgi:hypothetical protein